VTIRDLIDAYTPDEVYASIDDNEVNATLVRYEGYKVDGIDQLYRDLRRYDGIVALSDDVDVVYVDGNVDEWNYWTNTGERETMWYVFRVLGDYRFYKAEGYFSSEEGRQWRSLDEVIGRQRTVTDWIRT
jgi:hypothetical protein